MAHTSVTSAVFKGNTAVWVRYIYVGMYAWSYAWNHQSCFGMFGVMGCGVSYELYHFPLCLTYQHNNGVYKTLSPSPVLGHDLCENFVNLTWHRACPPWVVLYVVLILTHDWSIPRVGRAQATNVLTEDLLARSADVWCDGLWCIFWTVSLPIMLDIPAQQRRICTYPALFVDLAYAKIV